MRLSLALLLPAAPDEDRRLAELEVPRFHQVGGRLLAVLFILGAGLIGAVRDGSNPVLAMGLSAAAAAPYIVELAGVALSSVVFDTLVYLPVTGLGVATWLDEVHLGFGWPLLSFVVIIEIIFHAATGPRRRAVGATIAGAAVFGFCRLAKFHQDEDLNDLVIWHIALVIVVVLALAMRQIAVSLIAVREAREALAEQVMADERRQIARDVHDVVAHSLAVTMLHITAARMAVHRGEPDEAEEALEEAESHGRASLDDVRRIVRVLRTKGGTGIDAAHPDLREVEPLVDRYRAAGQSVELSLDADVTAIRPTTALAVYRILQEGLANAARHGRGPTTVALRASEGGVRLRIVNPLPDRPSDPTGRGNGLEGMRERAAAAGGIVHAGAQDWQWVVELGIPAGVSERGRAACEPSAEPAEATEPTELTGLADDSADRPVEDRTRHPPVSPRDAAP